MKDVAFKDNIIEFEEGLPYPIVLYCWTFLAFKKNKRSIPTFCNCQKRAIKNMIKDTLTNGIHPSERYSDPNRRWTLDDLLGGEFPESVIKYLEGKKVKPNENLINNLKFKSNLCHVCNKAIPHYDYCNPMYGGVFKRTYGWYINQEKYNLNISDNGKIPLSLIPKKFKKDYKIYIKNYLKEGEIWSILNYMQYGNNYSPEIDKETMKQIKKYISSKDIDKIILQVSKQKNVNTSKIIMSRMRKNFSETRLYRELKKNIKTSDKDSKEKIWKTIKDFTDENMANHIVFKEGILTEKKLIFKRLKEEEDIVKKIRKKFKTMDFPNWAENIVRQKLGYKKVGKAWLSETLLFNLIKKTYPKLKVIHHYRPSFLGHLELDIFIKDVNIGVEYQGEQHFMPLKHWGGEDSLKRGMKRDLKKKKLCEKNNIDLIYFNYDEDISLKNVKSKLSHLIDRKLKEKESN